MTSTNDAPVTVEREAQSLEALSDWLLANDHDMRLPDTVARDPRDIAATLRRLAALASAPAGKLNRDFTARRIKELIDEGDGFWRACSGCQEGVDGYVSERDYPFDPLFRCQPGGGCSECGGIGVLWDDGRGYDDITGDEEPASAVEAAQRLQALAGGAGILGVYGPEWCLFPTVQMRADIAAILALQTPPAKVEG